MPTAHPRPRARPTRSAARTLALRLAAIGAMTTISACTGEAADARSPAPLAAVSTGENGGYNALAVGADGTLHALWQDRADGSAHWQVFYGTSRDGVRWSQPMELGEPAEHVTRVALERDAAGRVYAIWKVLGTGALEGPEMNSSNALESAHGSLRYRVLEGGRWSPVVSVGRQNNVFGWFSAADPQGRVHLVWSENADPARESAMVWLDWANTVWHAPLDGASARRTRVVEEPGTGFHALDGYVDAAGQVHFVGIGNERLLYWNGDRLAVLREGVRANDGLDAPLLLRDAQGAGHLLVYDADAAAIVDHPLAEGGSVRAVFGIADPSANQVAGFQGGQDEAGRMLVTAQVTDAVRQAADLLVSASTGGEWSAPANLTRNAAGDRSAGFISTAGDLLVEGSAWSAKYASAAAGPGGDVNVLATNLRSVSSTRSDVTRFGGGWSYPQVFFTRVGGAAMELGAAPSPVPSPVDPQPAVPRTPAPAPPAPTPAPVPTPEAAPAPRAPAGAGGLPVGRYVCHYVSPYAGPMPTGQAVTILDGGRYRALDGGTGTYAFDAGAQTVSWRSGPFAAGGISAAFYRADGRPAIRVVVGDPSSDPGATNFCVLEGS